MNKEERNRNLRGSVKREKELTGLKGETRNLKTLLELRDKRFSLPYFSTRKKHLAAEIKQ